MPDAARPPWIENTPKGEPCARVMEDWVWYHVNDMWALSVNVVAESGPHDLPFRSQSLFLEAPDGDLFRLFDLSTDYYAGIVHWRPEFRAAWISRCEGGDACPVMQVDLPTGMQTDYWYGDALPSHMDRFDGPWNAHYVIDTPGGGELWALSTYLGDFEWFFLHQPAGGFVRIAGADAIEQDYALRYQYDRGVEAWITESGTYAVVLLQVPSGSLGVELPDVSEAQWVVINLSTNTAEVSEPFMPQHGYCRDARGFTESTGTAPPAVVRATCGGSYYDLVPMTSTATKVTD